jgi:hypothetical protein
MLPMAKGLTAKPGDIKTYTLPPSHLNQIIGVLEY